MWNNRFHNITLVGSQTIEMMKFQTEFGGYTGSNFVEFSID